MECEHLKTNVFALTLHNDDELVQVTIDSGDWLKSVGGCRSYWWIGQTGIEKLFAAGLSANIVVLIDDDEKAAQFKHGDCIN
jgi:hypothetical protein